MTEVVEMILTAEMLRTAIRAKLRVGAGRRAISLLIHEYAPEGARTMRTDDSVYRLPVEVISHERRLAFLDALNGLPEQRAAATTEVVEL